MPFTTVRYFPIPLSYTTRRGLSEKYHKKLLEKHHWIVWRGSSIGNYRRTLVYPNVYRKYRYLTDLLAEFYPEHLEHLFLLCAVHHGMPDFICYRNGAFKFVECKLGYETLKKGQVKCILKLQQMGFQVEIHRLVESPTKTRLSFLNIETKEKIMKETQQTITRSVQAQRNSMPMPSAEAY